MYLVNNNTIVWLKQFIQVESKDLAFMVFINLFWNVKSNHTSMVTGKVLRHRLRIMSEKDHRFV